MALFRKKRHRAAKLIILLLIAAAAVLLYDSNTRIVTDKYTIGNGRLPGGFEGLRIVQLSDLHTASFGEGNGRLISAVAAAEPDIIAITGDIIDQTTKAEKGREYLTTLMAGLTDIAPVYYVTGNHEWACGWTSELLETLEGCGVTVLRNEYVVLERGGDKIVLAGVDDPNGPYDMKTPEELVAEINAQQGDPYVLMLAHRNNFIDMWSDIGVDAVLCGHAHGGIVRLPFTDGLVAPGMEWFPTYTSGVYVQGGTELLVSRGIGNTRGTLRLLNNPQVVSVTLREN